MHTFHIPVMGTGFSIDTPVKVAPYGISSAISLVDDQLIEKMRSFYCRQQGWNFTPIPKQSEDHRARRITAYLNLVQDLVRQQFQEMINKGGPNNPDIRKYMQLLPDGNALPNLWKQLCQKTGDQTKLQRWLHQQLVPGSIDVNIMTKLDKENYNEEDEPLPREYNDAHAALRGFAKSRLSSSVIFSAGMNPRLYSYISEFDDFYPDEKGEMRKKVCLKVSDYRSALIQGKFLAKKGIWVSEYRIESGLNCGGHAFATQGHLMGPILKEFRDKREELIDTNFDIYQKSMETKERVVPEKPPQVRVTAQGGVGTAEEHRFLLDHYGLDSIGWGTPFLLVPEATNVDQKTLNQLCEAGEYDLELSDVSPLNVPFHNLTNSTKEQEKQALIEKGRPGSSCPNEYLELNTEFTDTPICTASRLYQYLKLKDLEEQNLDEDTYRQQYNKVVNKSCICVGLGTPALLVNGLDTRREGKGVSICPGPNMAYFSQLASLQEMVDHIYGRKQILKQNDRPHMFIKELQLYVDYWNEEVEESEVPLSSKEERYFRDFRQHLRKGIQYYRNLFQLYQPKPSSLAHYQETLHRLEASIPRLEVSTPS